MKCMKLAATALVSLVAASSFAAETSVAFDFEDMQAQAAAQEDKVDKARTVLHEIFSDYCVEKLVTASVNIRNDGKPDVEVDPNSGRFLITFKFAVNEDALTNWIVSSQAQLAQIADKVEDSKRDNGFYDDVCYWNGKQYTFDKSIRFKQCVQAFTPSRRAYFRVDIVSKSGETLFSADDFFEDWAEYDILESNPRTPMPQLFPKLEKREPVKMKISFGKCDFLSKVGEIKCSYGRFDDAQFPEIEKTHPTVKIPLQYGVFVEMVEVSPGKYCAKYPLTGEQYFAIMGYNMNRDDYQANRRYTSKLEYYGVPGAIRLFEKFKALQSIKDSEFDFRLPTETEWVFAAKGGSTDEISFGLLPNGQGDKKISAPGWIKENRSGDGFWFFDDNELPLGQKMPNAYGIHDMIGMYPELCSPEAKYGEVGQFCTRLCTFDMKGTSNFRKIFKSEYPNSEDAWTAEQSLRLFATKKGAK